MTLTAKFYSELVKNDPAFLIYQSSYNLTPFIHQQLLLWRLSVIYPVKVLIGDEIGLGKTIEAILTILMLKNRGAKRFLVLVPKILIDQWITELRKFLPETQIFKLRRENLDYLCTPNAPEGVYVISIDTAKKDRNARKIKRVKWDCVIVDEAHNLGGKSKRDNFVRNLDAEHKIFLSATPHRGDPKRYLRLLKHLDPSIKEDYDNPSFYQSTHDAILHRRTKRLVNRLEDFKVFPDCKVLAVVAQATETEKRFGNEIVEFLKAILKERDDSSPIGLLVAILRKRTSSSPRSAIKTLERIVRGKGDVKINETIAEKVLGESFDDLSEAMEELEVEETDEIYDLLADAYGNLLTPAEIQRLSEFIELAKKIESQDSKVNVLREIIRYHLSRGEKVIVFTEYKDTLDYLAEKLKDFDPVTIYGGLKDVEERFKQFKTVLIATDVASEGLNLQIANVVVNYEPPWTPLKLEQRMGRVWRMGQTREVYVYNLFLGIRADIELAELLYKKMMNVQEALKDVKNIIGEDVQFATSRTIETTEDMISTVPSSVKYKGKVERVTEYKLIHAQLKGELDEFVEAIINYVRELKSELSRKRVYPTENYTLIKYVCEELGLTSKPDKMKVKDEKAPEYIVLVTDKEGVDYVGIAEVDFGTHKLKIPFVYCDDSLLLGAKALEYVKEVEEKGVVPDEVFTPETLMPSEYAVKNRLREKLQPLIRPYKEYGWNVEIRDVKVNVFTKVLKLTTETLRSSKNYTRIVGFSAEKFVEDYLKFRGFEVKNRQTLRLYDLYAYDPSEDKPEGQRERERFVEVKGHGKGGREFLDVPEEEFEFGRKMGEKYWLYLVWNVLEGKPILIGFKNPYNRFKFTVKEKEVVIRKKVYEIQFD
jgi:superfamily II DNA or RNA helicase